METRQVLIGAFAVQNAKGTKVQKGVMLDGLYELSGWSRAKARRHLAAEARKPARGIPVCLPWRRPRESGPVAITLLRRFWTHCGEPWGK